ncbi:uncharacterized protein LOC114758124 [Neltuma alba]|uniref:uncharacterized protein LOC114758124 n=1 Tax=Neltuma alba TaxID=207710 RepID=UPI0010A4FD25|nr:uncharacterized protein LOC114758124 [Prosopis alba]
MIIGCISGFLILLLQILAFHPSPVRPSPSDPNASYILQDVLKAISAKQKWDFDDVRVSKFDVGKARFSSSLKYEFRIGLGRNYLLLRSSDQVGSWNKFRKPKSDLGSLIRRVSSLAVLDTFKLEGPFELGVDRHHQLTLSLPMNISYTGLKHVLVGEGITLEVKGAQEVSLFHSSDLDLQTNESTLFNKGTSGFLPFMQSMCMSLIPIRILGSASLVAYRARNPDLYIENTYISGDTIELLPEKCYHGLVYRKRACPINSFNLRLNMLEKVLRSLLSRRILQNQVSGLVKVNVKASSNVRFPIELERVVGSNITPSGALPKWRTRPGVERDWFQIWARVEADRLKPLMVKKLEPFIESDSISWGNLMSNVSFTKLRSVLVPPEALTLDVKW